MTQTKVKTLAEKRAEIKALKQQKKEGRKKVEFAKDQERIKEAQNLDKLRKEYNAGLNLITETPAEKYLRVKNQVDQLTTDSTNLYNQMSKLRTANNWDSAEIKSAVDPDAWELISIAMDEVIKFNEENREAFNGILYQAKSDLEAIADNIQENTVIEVEVNVVFDLRNKFLEWHEGSLAKYVEIQEVIMDL